MIEMKSLNGFEIVDAKAREDIEIIKQNGTGGGGSADLSNYYTKEETDTLLENVDADIVISDDGEGNVIIDAAPGSGEGGSSNVDLSNYYTKDETYSKTEVDALIPTGGGSSEGGAKVVILNDFSSSTTDEDRANVKELCEYYHSNNSTFPNTAYYIKYTSSEIYVVEKVYISPWNGEYDIYFYFTSSDGNKYYNYCHLDSDYNWSSGYMGNNGSSSSAKDWQWREVNNSSFYLGESTSHIKLIVQYDSDYFTYEISSRDGTNLYKSYDVYQVHRDETYENIVFNSGNVSISNGNIIGYYYWG